MSLPAVSAPCYSEFLIGMKVIYQHLPPVEIRGRKIVGRVFFTLLVLLSAVIGSGGAAAGVFHRSARGRSTGALSSQLDHRTLYDDQNRIIGSFALQRRVVANYSDFPDNLRNALISIEDKDFYRHWGMEMFGALLALLIAISNPVAGCKALQR